MGRMATYSGKVVKWDNAFYSQIQLADTDTLLSIDDNAPVQPDVDGRYPLAVPGSKSTIV